jgi:hypothetical protein
MLVILIILNIILLIITLYFIISGYLKKNNILDTFENTELLEFQKNLKDLIDELNKTINDKINDLSIRKKEIDSSIVLIDSKIKELKYLTERNQIIKQSEYKKEIAYEKPVTIKENNANNIKEKLLTPKHIRKDGKFEKEQEYNKIKIVIDENKKNEIDDLNLKYSQIHNLINNGISIEEISKTTGLTKGEIELIKNIKKY